MTRRALSCIAVLSLLATVASAATFIVPDDRTLVRNTDAIVLASALTSYTEVTDDNFIETVTVMSIEESIKGKLASGSNVDVREPGGIHGDRALIIAGVPQFEAGERYLLFLIETPGGWRVRDLVLGKFAFRADIVGNQLLVREEDEVVGWDSNGNAHREPRRAAQEFLEFVRSEARGRGSQQNYFVPRDPLAPQVKVDSTTVSDDRPGTTAALRLQPAPTAATSSPTTYTMTASSSSLGMRWNVFPSAVNWFSVGTEPGAPGNGVTAINAAFGAWNNDSGSNVNYVYAGADSSGTHTGGIGASDQQNTVAFERDLTRYGAGRFVCSGNSYSGTLGMGGVTRTSGSHSGPNNETFLTTTEGDVEMNQGIANCTLLFSNGDFNSAVAHEVGHTLGFRHSDRTRNNAADCATDPALECATIAIMRSFVPNGLNAALQPYDVNAVRAVYPGGTTTTPAPSAPTGVVATVTSTTSVSITWNVVTGATSYQVYRQSSAGTVLVGTTAATSFTDTTAAPNTAYLYSVRALNAGGSSVNSPGDLATTVIFTNDPLVAGTVVRAVHLAELRTAVNAVRALAGLGAAAFTDSAVPGVIIKSAHILELRAALDAARAALGLSTGGYTDPVLSGVRIKAIHFQEIRNRVK